MVRANSVQPGTTGDLIGLKVQALTEAPLGSFLESWECVISVQITLQIWRVISEMGDGILRKDESGRAILR